METKLQTLNKLEFNEELHEFKLDGMKVPSVTQVLRACGIIQDLSEYKTAMQRGSYVHLACEYLDKGELDESELDPEIIPYIEAYRKFKQENNFIPETIEERVFNQFYRYAGIIDRTGYINGIYGILDIKTGSIPLWTDLQVSGYTNCLRSMGFKVPLAAWGLNLKNTETYTLHDYTKDFKDNQFQFDCCAQVYWYKNRKGFKL